MLGSITHGASALINASGITQFTGLMMTYEAAESPEVVRRGLPQLAGGPEMNHRSASVLCRCYSSTGSAALKLRAGRAGGLRGPETPTLVISSFRILAANSVPLSSSTRVRTLR